MMTVSSLQDFSLSEKTVVALGFFDGVHQGHRAVLQSAAIEARARGCRAMAFTFSAESELPGAKRGGCIYADETRAQLLFSCGMNIVLQPPFSEFSHLGAREFARLLCEKLGAGAVVCGEDYRFSAGAAAGTGELEKYCGQLGAETIIVPPVLCEGERVSSTQLRALLRAGEIKAANTRLGAPYRIDSRVTRGAGQGRTLGFPTANQPLPALAVLPRAGVYASRATINGKPFRAVTNIGVAPTIGDGRAPRAESHILDYTGGLYGRQIIVELLAFLRDEKKFDSIEELRAQITRDCEQARGVY